ncbi:MAG: DUF2157 domain-containing protein [Desulfobacterales bacterium]|nr:MAG: DUF2157 domain-containing protein [Desulfobacterales bacterium]
MTCDAKSTKLSYNKQKGGPDDPPILIAGVEVYLESELGAPQTLHDQHHWKWLTAQIPAWVAHGILEPDQAERLLRAAPPADPRHTLLTRILIGISALLFGLGVISFFAFNWEAMAKWLKLITIFTAFIGAHSAGYTIGRLSSRQALAEFFHLLGSLFFGAAIMLIAQIYHIDEHAPNGVLFWSLGVLMMAYTLNSTPQILLFGILAVVWQALERRFHSPQPGAVFLTAAALIPFAIHKKHWFATAIATVTVLIVIIIQLTIFPVAIVGSLLGLGVLALGASLLIRRTSHAACAAPPEVAGSILYFAALIAMTFAEGVHAGLFKTSPGAELASLFLPIFIAVTTIIVWSAFCYPFETFCERLRQTEPKHFFLAFLAFMITLFLALIYRVILPNGYRSELALTGMTLFNALALAHGIVLIFAGTRNGRIGTSFIGCLLVVVVILARFAAYADDLLLRSAAFVLAGAFVLWIALKTSKVKRERIVNAKA